MMVKPSPATTVTGRAVWAGRVVFVGCLMAATAGLGTLTHRFLSSSEKDLASQQFESIAKRALVEANKIATQARLTATTMATTVAIGSPDATSWPFVFHPGFDQIATDMLQVAGSITLGLAPFVTEEQRLEFEEFAYTNFEVEYEQEGMGMSSFGKGIWFPSRETGAPDNRVRETNVNRWGSQYDIYAPVIQMNEHALGGLMFNVHFDSLRGGAVDRVIACVDQGGREDCGSLTTFIQSFKWTRKDPPLF
eukprot:scaffold1465_cov179-Amphora_coffeaeformis.AAC.4